MINGSILVSGGASGLGAAVVAKLSQLRPKGCLCRFGGEFPSGR